MLFSQTRLRKLRHQAAGGALLSGEVAVVCQRHAWGLPPQRIHDPSQILAAGEQVLVEPDPRRVRADALEQSRQILAREIRQRAKIERALDDRPEDRPDRPRVQRDGADVIFDPGLHRRLRNRLAQIPGFAARDAVDRPTAHGGACLVAPHLHPPKQRP